MTEQAIGNGLVPNKPYFAIYKNPATAKMYDETFKRIMYIDACKICRHCIEGAEDGGKLDPFSDDFEPERAWYYCQHPDFTGWPKRIGQHDKLKEVAYFCPLESLVKINDDLIKVSEEDKNKKERAKKQTAPKTGQSEMPVGGMASQGIPHGTLT